MRKTFESNLQAMRDHRAAVQAIALKHLELCVKHRTQMCDTVERLDPGSKWARESRAQLAKARDEYAKFAALIGTLNDLANATSEPPLPHAMVISTPPADAPPGQGHFMADSFLFAR